MTSPPARSPHRSRDRSRPTAVAGTALVVGMLALSTVSCATGLVLSVGPGHPFATPCQAIAAARPGDTIEIDAAGNGTYDGDVCSWSTNNLTIKASTGGPTSTPPGRTAAARRSG